METFEAYYKLGIRYIDKLEKAVFSDDPQEQLRELIQKERTRAEKNYNLVWTESYFFCFNVLTALIGLNKEKIEENGINNNYDYNLNEKIKEGLQKEPTLTRLSNQLNKESICSSKYDSFLSVTNCDYFGNDFIFNIRNGILHSEFEPDAYNQYIFDIMNSNYTHFQAKILFNSFAKYIKFYFGNSNYYNVASLKTSIHFLALEDENMAPIANYEELTTAVMNTDVLTLQNTDPKETDINKTTEALLIKTITKNLTIDDNKLPKELQQSIKKVNPEYVPLIAKICDREKNFYTWDIIKQYKFVTAVHNFIADPVASLSNFSTFYFDLIQDITLNEGTLEKSQMHFNTGVDKLSVLFLKLFLIMYRIQNKGFKDIDYSLLNINSGITYSETGNVNGLTPSNFAYQKEQTKNPHKSHEEIKKTIFCDIIRNALAHGKITCNYDLEGNVIVHFNDTYKNRERTLTMGINSLREFVDSPSFYSINVQLQDNYSKTK